MCSTLSLGLQLILSYYSWKKHYQLKIKKKEEKNTNVLYCNFNVLCGFDLSHICNHLFMLCATFFFAFNIDNTIIILVKSTVVPTVGSSMEIYSESTTDNTYSQDCLALQDALDYSASQQFPRSHINSCAQDSNISNDLTFLLFILIEQSAA